MCVSSPNKVHLTVVHGTGGSSCSSSSLGVGIELGTQGHVRSGEARDVAYFSSLTVVCGDHFACGPRLQ